MLTKTLCTLLASALAGMAQQLPAQRQLARVASNPRAVSMVGVLSAGIDAAGSVGHVQGISRVGPVPSQDASLPSQQTTAAIAAPSIVYTCDATINALPGVCTTLNTTIASLYTSRFTDVNARIYIQFGATGLGQSDSAFNLINYTSFRNALNADQTDASDVLAFTSSVPATNPINSTYQVWLTNPNARALGIAANTGLMSDGSTFCTIGTTGCYDAIITISSSVQALGHLFYRTGSITGSQYDFYSVVEHETDEVLGTSSCAFPICNSSPQGIQPPDLFRYSSSGSRSFAAGNNNSCTSSSAGNACFSLDGIHMLQAYNNLNNGQDSGDWVPNCVTPLVQNASACPGVGGLDISPVAEILVLDVVGYNLTLLDPTAVSPAFGSGATHTFTFTFNAPNGYQSLTVTDVLINNFLNGIGACYVAFVGSGASSGTVYLVDDAGDAGGPFASMTLPGSGTAQNSQCSIAATGSSVSGSGNTLTLALVITFKPAFAGNKVMYTAAQDNSPANSGWQPLGVWNVPGSVGSGPAVGGMSPAHSSSANQTYTFTFTDTNGFADLSVLDVLINNFLDGIGACYVALVPSGPTAGTVYLVDDGGDAGGPYTSLTLPGAGAAQNSQCMIAGSGSSISASGTTLLLILNITFKPAFSGNRVMYLAAGSTSLNSGWQSVGTVNVP
jgi:hypothetical protein